MANIFKPQGNLNPETRERDFSTKQKNIGAFMAALSPTVGSAVSMGYDAGGIGNAVTNIGNLVNTGDPMTDAFAKMSSALLGGGINLLFGEKKNEANRNTFNNSVNTINSFTGGASSTDALNDQLDSLGAMYNIRAGLTGSDGLMSDKNATYAKNLRDDQQNAYSKMVFAANKNVEDLDRSAVTDFERTQFALGGDLRSPNHTNGMDLPSLFNIIGSGGTHENNPYGGVPIGTDIQGTPNLVEEGEVVVGNKFVLSNRKKVPDEDKKYLGFGGGTNATYADIGKNLEKFYSERNDDISKRTLEQHLQFLADSQEKHKKEEAQDALEQQLLAQGIDPEEYYAALEKQQAQQEQIAADQAMQQQIALQQEGQPMIAAYGGSIHIDPSKRGTFTAAAKRHGKSVQEFASQVLANKDNYSPAMVKKANFARNAAKWHDLGGALDNYYRGANIYEEGTSNMRNLLDYNAFNSILPIVTSDNELRDAESQFRDATQDEMAKKVNEESRLARERWNNSVGAWDDEMKKRKDPLGEESLVVYNIPMRAKAVQIPKGVPQTVTQLKLNVKPKNNQEKNLAPFAGARFTPIGASLGSYIAGLFDKPSQLETAAIDEAIGKLHPVNPVHINDYRIPQHVSYTEGINPLLGQNAATRRTLFNLGNPLAAPAGILAADDTLVRGFGNVVAAADKENYERDVSAFKDNRDTNIQNANWLANARQQNAGINDSIAKLAASRGTAALNAYNNYWDRQNKRWDNTVANVGNLGREAFAVNMAMSNPALLYALQDWVTGKIGYKGIGG